MWNMYIYTLECTYTHTHTFSFRNMIDTMHNGNINDHPDGKTTPILHYS